MLPGLARGLGGLGLPTPALASGLIWGDTLKYFRPGNRCQDGGWEAKQEEGGDPDGPVPQAQQCFLEVAQAPPLWVAAPPSTE